VKVEVFAEHTLAACYGTQSIPTVAVFRDGEPVSGFVGAFPPAIIGSFLDKLLAEAAAA
jgi:putative thioredoxin